MILQVGVKIALNNEAGKYLILKRNFELEKYKDVKQTDAWDIVGGRIDPGSSLLDNLRREIREETGLEYTGEPTIIAHQDILRSDKHVVRLTFIGDIEEKPIILSEEHSEYAWLSTEELVKLPDIDPFLKEIIDSNLLI
jgi:8-oxo-dGTP pyrophosphatase MutT (NUDIX family)